MKLKDINKIKELIAERLDDMYDIKADWEEIETRNGEPMWVHRDDVFEMRVFYWSKRETNRGTWVTKPVDRRDATVVIGFEDTDNNYVERIVRVSFHDGVVIPEENIHTRRIFTDTDIRVDSHHVASYSKEFMVNDANANLDNFEYNGGKGYMKLIWEIFDGKG